MDYKEKVIALLNSQELSDEQKRKLEAIFPELKESEDERIRKELIQYLKDCPNLPNGICCRDDFFAWLEKQGEHKKFRDSIQVGDKVTRNEDGVLVNLSQLKRVAKPADVVESEKQGEQKPIDKIKPKFRVGDVMRTLQEASDDFTDGMPVVVSIDDEYYHCTNELIAIKNQDDYEYPPINREQKPAWSEEDKCMLNNVIDTLKPLSQTIHSGYAINSMIAWLKSIKDKVQPQPKQEWSEEDEYNIAFIVELLYGIEDSDKEYENKCRKTANWLKSLIPHNTWKPSDEQIGVIEAVINNRSFQRRHLDSLYADLKKLRKE